MVIVVDVNDLTNEDIKLLKRFLLKQEKKKLEFMQKAVISTLVIAIFYTSLSYLLSFLDKNPVEQLTITIVQFVWGAVITSFLAYMTQNCMRAKWFGDKTANTNKE